MITISHIERSLDTNNRKTISVSYDNDGSPMCLSAPETEEISAAVISFVMGNTSADDLVRAMASTDTRAEIKDALTPLVSRVSENLTFDGDHVYYDGDPFKKVAIDEVLEDHLVRLIKAGTKERDLKAWAAFTERLYGNSCIHTRSHIMRWLVQQNWLTLDERGRLVGYRGCDWDIERDCPVSVHQGFAIVDGVRVNGHVPNPVGAVVEMPRAMVQHDPSLGCSSGLHVGTYDYAVSWAPEGGAVIRVAVAPEDIVSVPTDCSSSKIRCCRFEVLDCERIPEREDYENDLTYRDDDEDVDDEPTLFVW